MYLFCGDKRWAKKNGTLKETNYSSIVSWLSFIATGGKHAYSGKQFVQGFIIFLYLHLIMGVPGNLVIGFT